MTFYMEYSPEQSYFAILIKYLDKVALVNSAIALSDMSGQGV